jgi:hypothetical protein
MKPFEGFGKKITDPRQMSFNFEHKPVVIAFGYTARSGKGECCDTIYSTHSVEHGGKYNILRLSFAQHLRDEIHEALSHYATFERDPQDAMKALCGWAGVDYDPHPLIDAIYPWGKQRQLLQWWGTEYRRARNPNYWLDYADAQIKASGADVVLIDDLRFENEFAYVKANGYTVETRRVGMKPICNGIPGHTSEGALKGFPFDYLIEVKDGQLDLLHQKALVMFKKIMEKESN